MKTKYQKCQFIHFFLKISNIPHKKSPDRVSFDPYPGKTLFMFAVYFPVSAGGDSVETFENLSVMTL